MLKMQPELARAKADRIVRNTHRTLMTRGMMGCYVYCTDARMSQYLKEAAKGRASMATGARWRVLPRRQLGVTPQIWLASSAPEWVANVRQLACASAGGLHVPSPAGRIDGGLDLGQYSRSTR